MPRGIPAEVSDAEVKRKLAALIKRLEQEDGPLPAAWLRVERSASGETLTEEEQLLLYRPH